MDDQVLADFLHLMIDLFAETLDAQRISILLQNPLTRKLEVEASLGLSEEVISSVEIHPGEGIAGLAFEERLPILIQEGRRPEYLRVPLAHPEIRFSLVIPMYQEGHSLGVICASTQGDPQDFTPRNLDWMVEVANRLCPVLLSLQEHRRQQQDMASLLRFLEVIERLGHLRDEEESIELALKSAAGICQTNTCFYAPCEGQDPRAEIVMRHCLQPYA